MSERSSSLTIFDGTLAAAPAADGGLAFAQNLRRLICSLLFQTDQKQAKFREGYRERLWPFH